MDAMRSAFVAAALVASGAAAQEPAFAPLDAATFAVYTRDGATSSLDAILRDASLVDVLFIGERHNDVVGHRIEYELYARLLEARGTAGAAAAAAADLGATERGERPLILSLEMFDRDVQTVLDEYVGDVIREDHFLAASRPWPCYAEDYKPLVEAAKRAGERVIAANAPRRYVNLVSREGPAALDGLSADAKRSLPPLPYAAPSAAYAEELRRAMGAHGGAADPTQLENGNWAQALWDATMAYSIADALMREPAALVVHLAGSFHVGNGTGIPEHLARYRPGTRMLTVMLEPANDVNEFRADLAGSGDYVIQTAASQVRPSAPPGSPARSDTCGRLPGD